jgi:hypothetical protein
MLPDIAKIPGIGRVIPQLGNIKGLDQILGAVTKITEISRSSGLA